MDTKCPICNWIKTQQNMKKAEKKAETRVAVENVALKILVFSGESLWWCVIFVNRHADGQWSLSFSSALQVFSFLATFVIFWAAVFESTFGRLLLEQHFSYRDLVIRP